MAEKKNISLRTLVFNDKSLIFVALILAVIVWVITSLNIGTDETKTISVQVPIELSDEFSEQLGMRYYSLLDTVEVKVTISGAKYVIGQVKDTDLSVKLDTSSVNRAGTQSIPIIVTNKSRTKDFTVTSTYPSSIDAYFDVEESKTFDITLVYDKDLAADGFVFGTPVLSEDRVTVIGPKAFVDKIEHVNANADFDGAKELNETYTGECELSVVGAGVEANYLRLTSVNDEQEELKSVAVQFPVLKDEYLPVNVEFTDIPTDISEGDVKVRYSSDYLHAGVLASADVTTATVGTVSYHSLKPGKNTFTFDTDKLQGVMLLEDADPTITVTVNVSDEFEEIRVPVKNSDVLIEGGKEGSDLKVRKLKDYNIRLIVPKDTVIEPENLTVKADVSSEAEDNIYPLTITVANNSCWVYGEYEATIY